MNKRYILSAVAVLLIGCGGGGGSTNSTDSQTEDSSSSLLSNSNPKATNLKVTGQTISYGSGEENATGTLRDDGFYQIGIKNNYTRDEATEIVTDNLIGLMWQDDSDAKTIEKAWSAFELEGLDLPQKSGEDIAIEYCKNLNLGDYSDWRLPSVEELSTILNYAQEEYIFDPIFQNVADSGELSFYWSDRESKADSEMVWTVNPKLGSLSYDTSLKILPGNMRCVRGDNPIIQSSMSRDNQGVVTDSSNLQWQDNYSDNETEVKVGTWAESIEYCESLELAGYGDWRLPNINELLSITNFIEANASSILDKQFKNSSDDGYWSSTSTPSLSVKSAYLMNYSTGTSTACKCEQNSVRCVRTK